MGEFWNMAYSVCKAIGDWYWGGFDGLLSSLAVFIVTVHITNGMCAIFDRRPIGRADVQEIFKSALIFILEYGIFLIPMSLQPHPLCARQLFFFIFQLRERLF